MTKQFLVTLEVNIHDSIVTSVYVKEWKENKPTGTLEKETKR